MAPKKTYRPKDERPLALVRLRAVRAPGDLTDTERRQLEALANATCEAFFDGNAGLELADVVDAEGVALYQLFTWDHGIGMLVRAGTGDVVVEASGGDALVWNAAQRDLFYAMDHALRKAERRPAQPLNYNWWDESDWARSSG